MTDKITVTMTETVAYTKTYTVEKLAAVLRVKPVEAVVRAALDPSNETFGTTIQDDESLLDDIIGNYTDLDIPERSWEVS